MSLWTGFSSASRQIVAPSGPKSPSANSDGSHDDLPAGLRRDAWELIRADGVDLGPTLDEVSMESPVTVDQRRCIARGRQIDVVDQVVLEGLLGRRTRI